MKRKILILTSVLFFLGMLVNAQVEEIVTDIDGNVYKTVTIGGQTWMAENLKTTKYNDGMEIYNSIGGKMNNPLGVILSETGAIKSNYYCWYQNDEVTYKKNYGALYTYGVIKTEKVCPIGWHVPSIDEWYVLFEKLGGVEIAGTKLKENLENNVGFNARLGGYNSQGQFFNFNAQGLYWSSTGRKTIKIRYNKSKVVSFVGSGHAAFSVRCIKD